MYLFLLSSTELTCSSVTLFNRLCPSLTRYHSASLMCLFCFAKHWEVILWWYEFRCPRKKKTGSLCDKIHTEQFPSTVCLSTSTFRICLQSSAQFLSGLFDSPSLHQSILLNDSNPALPVVWCWNCSLFFFLLSYVGTRTADKAFYKQPNSDVIGFVYV